MHHKPCAKLEENVRTTIGDIVYEFVWVDNHVIHIQSVRRIMKV